MSRSETSNGTGRQRKLDVRRITSEGESGKVLACIVDVGLLCCTYTVMVR